VQPLKMKIAIIAGMAIESRGREKALLPLAFPAASIKRLAIV